jgi:hypothetical protein
MSIWHPFLVGFELIFIALRSSRNLSEWQESENITRLSEISKWYINPNSLQVLVEVDSGELRIRG